MTNFAIVIGIDKYANPSWNLSGAGSDALAFAEWVRETGGVEEQNLRLLLSSGARVPSGVATLPADRRTIISTIQEFQNGAGRGGDRLYFYYAGHGVSAPGAAKNGIPEPVLIPADVQSLQLDNALLIGFSEIVPVLEDADPPEQLFFIDACRDFALEEFQPGVGRSVGPWRPTSSANRQASAQLMLYATSPGQRAFERKALKKGIFGDVLMRGLQGDPGALVFSGGNQRYEVHFASLAEFVQRTVQQSVKRALPTDWLRYVQVPQPWTARATDAILRDFEPEEVGTQTVRLRVRPSKARVSCEVKVLQYLSGAGKYYVIAELDPEIPVVAKLELPPGAYSLRANAERFAEHHQVLEVAGPQTIDVKLAPASEAGSARGGRRRGSAALADLTVRSYDQGAFIAVWDADRKPLGSAIQTVTLKRIRPGIYRARMVTPDGEPVDELIDVPAGAAVDFPMVAPGPRVGDAQLLMLAARGIDSHHGYIRPSENLGAFANASLTSLLSFAAFAAHWPHAGDFDRLRKFGVTPVPEIPAGMSALLVLIGCSGEEPARGIGRDVFLSRAEFIVRDLQGNSLGQSGLDRLSGFDAASQAQLRVEAGSMTLELRLPGLAPTRYALAALPGRVTVLVVVLEDSGEVEVQQYLLPVGAQARHDEFLTQDPSNIGRLELAQRFYASGSIDADAEAIEGLLYGKWLDPLLGCIGGYALIRAGRADRYVGHPDGSPSHYPEPSAMRNMLKFYDALPDSHVLAALADPDHRDEHFAAALTRGLPVFAEGFQALRSWSHERADRAWPLWVQQSAVLPGSPWTAWVALRPALLIRSGTFADAPPGWTVLEEHRSAIEASLAAVGKISCESADGQRLFGTGFLVGPRLVLTASHVAALAFKGNSRRWRRTPVGSVSIDLGGEALGDEPRAVAIDRLVAVDEPHQLALLRLAADPAGSPTPLQLGAILPHPYEGRRVYVVGYPSRDSRVPEDVMEQAFGGTYDVKRLQPGQTLHVPTDEARFSHDCFTLGGNGGSPVIDIDTGRVIGLHVAGEWVDFKRGRAISLWKLAGTKVFADGGIDFV